MDTKRRRTILVLGAGLVAAVAAAPARITAQDPSLRWYWAPAASWAGAGARIDIWHRYGDAGLTQQYFDIDGWHGHFPFGGPLVSGNSEPSVTWTEDGRRQDVFVTGANGHVYQMYWTRGGRWLGWFDRGGTFSSAPSAAWSRNGDRLDLVAFGSDRRLWHTSWTPSGGWTAWVPHDGPPSGADFRPSLTSSNDGGKIDVFVTARNGHLYHKSLQPARGWIHLGGTLISEPAAAWAGNRDRIDVFGVGNDRRLYWTRREAGGRWTPWEAFVVPGGQARSGPATTWTRHGFQLDVFVLGGDTTTYRNSLTPWNGWSGWVALP